MRKKKIEVLYKDEAIVVCVKPKGMPTASDKSGDMDLLHQLKNQLFFEEKGTNEPELYVVHRLDRPVGGVMVFARTKEAAANLSEQIRNHQFQKDYQAVLTGWLPEDEGTFRDFLLKDERKNVSKVVKEGTPGAREAVLDYEVIDMMESKKMKYTYCLIHLLTGRHHQIRVQTSSRGFGIWGDTKYNPLFQKTKKKYKEIGLYATRISFCHPVTNEKRSFKVEPSGEAFELLEMTDY
ncbi:MULTISPECIES: RluA family pseudouridine synthase [Anaerostipes]|uniref:RluA family pseudouridine synthase n=1 Tax=Anaerostipes TaxID=207244 RepID=UPI0009523B41|nr:MULTISPECIES: RNA pseudouridine synthase [unclassified Anaerostipes]MCI5622722.1 RNA pseudouridine synthase [Anaerostipes sp.]MDY2726245.1 RNA pseudouridine synthase [Anaerostipes faecalis]OLR59890.1 RNA pseudouridine synthase [Anaerostipes sp. 494a]